MCRSEGLTPKSTDLLGALLESLRTGLARRHDCDPDEITIGPVDFGPPADWCPECSEGDEPGTCEPGTCPGRPFPEDPAAIARMTARHEGEQG